jgi:hypothetical protein
MGMSRPSVSSQSSLALLLQTHFDTHGFFPSFLNIIPYRDQSQSHIFINPVPFWILCENVWIDISDPASVKSVSTPSGLMMLSDLLLVIYVCSYLFCPWWYRLVGWILGYHSALTQPLQLGRGGEPTPITCAYIYHSVDLLYSAIESSFSTDTAGAREPCTRLRYSECLRLAPGQFSETESSYSFVSS